MRTLCIVPCGNRKIWGKNPKASPTKAKEVYVGPFTSKCRTYAEKFYPKSYCILSAKYGFLFPDDVVPGPYDVTFKDKITMNVHQCSEFYLYLLPQQQEI